MSIVLLLFLIQSYAFVRGQVIYKNQDGFNALKWNLDYSHAPFFVFANEMPLIITTYTVIKNVSFYSTRNLILK